MVDVFELARTGATVEGEIALQAMARLRDSLRETAGSLRYRLTGRTDTMGRPAAALSLQGELTLTCDRCGLAVTEPLDHRATFYFVRDAEELEMLPVTADQEPEPLVGSSVFDLAALVEDEAILCVPLSPRHDKCPIEGAGAEVANDRSASPFAALKVVLRKNGH